MGSVSVSTYEGKDGTTKASLEVTADEVEFLSPRQEQEAQGQANSGFTDIEEDELPF